LNWLWRIATELRRNIHGLQVQRESQAGGEQKRGEQQKFFHRHSSGGQASSAKRTTAPEAARQPLVKPLQAVVFQAVGMLAVDRDRVRFKQAGQAEGLVDLIEVVHPVVIADYLAHARAAAANQAVVGFAIEG